MKADRRSESLAAPRATPEMISRRDAIQRVSAMLGGVALVGGSGLLAACADRETVLDQGQGLFDADEIALLDEIADTILPETSTPGAKAAAVGPFIAHMVAATYDPQEQQTFREGLVLLDEASVRMLGSDFMAATPEERLRLLEALDQEQMDYMNARQAARSAQASSGQEPADTSLQEIEQARQGGERNPATEITADAPVHYFRMMKELTMLGYFTSEIGYTQAMRYQETPGRFDPCVPYAPGEKAWAPHA